MSEHGNYRGGKVELVTLSFKSTIIENLTELSFSSNNPRKWRTFPKREHLEEFELTPRGSS